MKTNLRNLLSAAVLAFIFIYNPLFSQAPDSLIREDDPELKKERREWIELMHRTEPGVDWKILDRETRLSKYRIKNAQRKELLEEGKLNRDRILREEVAGGRIIGAWTERGSNNLAGRMITVDVDFDRKLIYGISAGGNVWRGTLEGKNWTCLNDYHKFSGSLIKILKKDGKNRILVVSSKTVYFSDDEGLTWNSAEGLDDIQFWGSIRRGAVMNNSQKSIYVLARTWDREDWKAITAIYRSNDKGETFEKYDTTSINARLIDLWAPRDNSSDLYIMKRDTVHQINGSGNIINTEIFTGDLPVSEFNKLKAVMLKGTFDEHNDLILYSVLRTGESPKSHFYLSSDKGDNWEAKGALDINPFMINSFAVSQKHSNVLFYGGVELFRSYDEAVTWTKVNRWGEYYGDPKNKLHADIPGINLFIQPGENENEIAYISTDGGLYKSEDYIMKVENISLRGLNISQYYSVYTHGKDNNYIFTGSQDQGFQRCDVDSGGTLSFDQTISGDYGHLISSDEGETLWCVYPGFVLNYTNTRDKLQQRRWSFRNNSNRLWLPKIVADPDKPQRAFIAAGGKSNPTSLWDVHFSGDTLKADELAYDFSGENNSDKISTFEISKTDPELFYVITNSGIFYVSTDKGKSWQSMSKIDKFGGHYFYGAKILPSDKESSKLYIGGSGYNNPGFYFSNDYGQTFIPADSGLPNTLIYDLTFIDNENYIFAATQVGPYVYIVEENKWYDLAGFNTPDQTYWEVEYVPAINTVRCVTYGRGIWDFKIDEFTGIREHTALASASNIDVMASPNPFTDKSEITVNLDEQASGIVKIYDTQGRVVRKLFEGQLNAGENQFHWDGLTAKSNLLPSGAYICVVSAGGNSAYVKLMLEK